MNAALDFDEVKSQAPICLDEPDLLIEYCEFLKDRYSLYTQKILIQMLAMFLLSSRKRNLPIVELIRVCTKAFVKQCFQLAFVVVAIQASS